MMLEIIRANAADKGNRGISNFSFYLKADKKEKIWIALESTKIFIEKLSLLYTLD
jgi:hypothetical protein